MQVSTGPENICLMGFKQTFVYGLTIAPFFFAAKIFLRRNSGTFNN